MLVMNKKIGFHDPLFQRYVVLYNLISFSVQKETYEVKIPYQMIVSKNLSMGRVYY